MGWLKSFLHPEKGYEDAQDELEKYYNQSQGYLQPYNQHGMEAYGGINEAMKRLLNPVDLENEWNNAYKESDAAKLNEGIIEDRGLGALSSMGLMGSSPGLQALQAGRSKVVLDEKNRFLENLMNKYLAGVGVGQNIYGTGANTANSMSNNAMNMGNKSADLEYGKESAGGNMFSNILGTVGGIAGSALAGPIGEALAKRWNLTGSRPGGA